MTGNTYFTDVDSVVADALAEALGEADGPAEEGVGPAEEGAGVGVVAVGSAGGVVAAGCTNCGVAAAEVGAGVPPQPVRQTAKTVRPERVRSNRTGPSWQNPAGPADP
ncbi:hypothetical protein ACWKSP_17590 [Micromonosporaceae bacterium Da 78-11]